MNGWNFAIVEIFSNIFTRPLSWESSRPLSLREFSSSLIEIIFVIPPNILAKFYTTIFLALHLRNSPGARPCGSHDPILCVQHVSLKREIAISVSSKRAFNFHGERERKREREWRHEGKWQYHNIGIARHGWETFMTMRCWFRVDSYQYLETNEIVYDFTISLRISLRYARKS